MKDASHDWPPLDWNQWGETAETLQMFAQIVGKTRLGLTPMQNHWWNVPLYVTVRGLSTSAMPLPDGDRLEIEFDFMAHELAFRRASGQAARLPLEPQTVADFYAAYRRTLSALGVEVTIHPMPVECPGPIRFDRDVTHRSYDSGAVERFWRILGRAGHAVQAFFHRLLRQDQSRALFLGFVRPGGHALQRPQGTAACRCRFHSSRGVLT